MLWPDLSHLTVHPLDLVVRAGVIYLVILLLLRLAGKRQMGQMGPTEFVVVLLISNAVQNSMNGGDNSLIGGILLAVVLVAMSWLISLATFRSARIRMLFEGTPTLLIHKGVVIQKHLDRERMTHSELKVLLRKQGIHSFKEVHTAILEPDGYLSVIKEAEAASIHS